MAGKFPSFVNCEHLKVFRFAGELRDVRSGHLLVNVLLLTRSRFSTI